MLQVASIVAICNTYNRNRVSLELRKACFFRGEWKATRIDSDTESSYSDRFSPPEHLFVMDGTRPIAKTWSLGFYQGNAANAFNVTVEIYRWDCDTSHKPLAH